MARAAVLRRDEQGKVEAIVIVQMRKGGCLDEGWCCGK